MLAREDYIKEIKEELKKEKESGERSHRDVKIFELKQMINDWEKSWDDQEDEEEEKKLDDSSDIKSKKKKKKSVKKAKKVTKSKKSG